jgi:DNA-binding LytR/AlgR family response regulator
MLEKEKYRIKTRLYKLEETLPQNYVKINQSTIINIQKIDSFSSDFTGTLKVKLKNGFCDYVSRRNLKSVKERLGV